jgi:ABC-type spermidine/putrescine transport system permease subunit II
MASRRLSRFNIASLTLGLAFLYLPIVILVIYSFNASRLVTVWGGWSLRWYHEFFNDDERACGGGLGHGRDPARHARRGRAVAG